MSISSTLYIHIPFCRSKCAYCDFYSSAAKQYDLEAYIHSLLREWSLRKQELPALPETIYLGGGTPSILSYNNLSQLINGLGKDINIKGIKEFTIEANPEDITKDSLSQYHNLNINRISIGVQSFNSSLLNTVNRCHAPEDAVNALRLLSQNSWNYSADLIYGLPNQTLEMWKEDLRNLLSFRPPHFSAYLLSYEPGTPLFIRREKGMVTEVSDTLAEEMYNVLCEEAASAGYLHYEISNFALPEYEAKHNSAYWDDVPYLGLGPAAHSLGADGVRRYNPPSIKKYMETLKTSTYYNIDEEDDNNRVNDLIITALRTAKGLNPKDIPEQYHREFKTNCNMQLRSGMLQERPDGTLFIPERFWLRADAILRDLIVG